MGQKTLLFSERYNLADNILSDYGAIEINFLADRPLFIDPMLIFNSTKKDYKLIYDSIICYLKFLFSKCKDRVLSKAELKTWFMFNEVKENWLGYSRSGNEGCGLDIPFGRFFSSKINMVLDTNNISKTIHFEKISLLDSKIGKDKISDFTTNLIKSFLAEYTQTFALKYLKKTDYEEFPVDKAEFDYNTESFITKRYFLPYVIKNKKGRLIKEYVLLTPRDILREEDQSINYNDMISNKFNICRSIDNEVLRTNIENFIQVQLDSYKQECIEKKKKIKDNVLNKIEKTSFDEIIKMYPVVLDYYIKYKEENPEGDLTNALLERQYNDTYYSENAKAVKTLINQNFSVVHSINPSEEAINRITEFKRIMEVEGYKYCYNENNIFVKKEPELQMMFRLALIGSAFNIDKEVNNGSGPVDFKISYGKELAQLIEFKLASNPKLTHVFKQVASYENANNTGKAPFIVVFYSNDKEFNKVNKILIDNKKLKQLNKTIFIINCKKKVSASNEK